MKAIREIMSTSVKTIQKGAPLMDVVLLMTKHTVSCVVVEEEQKPVGIITERDLIKKVLSAGKDPKKLKAQDIMTAPVLSVSPETRFGVVAKMLKERNIRRILVTENDKLLGIVTQTDITNEAHHINALNQHMNFHMNIQSWVIIGIFTFVIIYIMYILFAG